MAQVQIADVYNPAVFAGLEQEMNTRENKFIVSGVMVNSPLMASVLSPGGNIAVLSGYNPLTYDEPNYSSDNPASSATAAKVTNATQTFRMEYLNKVWSTMDLATILALQDPKMAILNNIVDYWKTDTQNRLLKICLGILADSVASHSGDMLFSVATDANSAVTDAERISAVNVIKAWKTLGDKSDKIGAIGMHSDIYHRLQAQNLIVYLQPATTPVAIPTYLGKVVIYDDSFPAVMGTYRITYTCILFGQGVFGYTQPATPSASEVYRLPLVGDGRGQDFLISRRDLAIHPFGYTFTSAAINGNSISATYADLALATNWDRVWGRKNIALAFLQVND